MKVALVTGPCPLGQCGVGDYTVRLATALMKAGVEAQVIAEGSWSLGDVFSTNRLLRNRCFDIVHIQYPTAGFGRKLGPQALSLLRASVITIHEASQRRFLRKLSLFPFLVRPQHLIFTSSFERRFLAQCVPWVMRCSSIIPVGSNIPEPSQGVSRTLAEVVHFGLITPHKGIEDVLELARLIGTSGRSLMVRIIGQVPAQHAAYGRNLRLQAARLPVVWHHDLEADQVARLLGQISLAYLPFPDGASERRTTLKTALLSGLAVLTTVGPHTPRPLRDVVLECASPLAAFRSLSALLDDPQQIVALSSKAVDYARRYSWERIAGLHVGVYESVLGERSSAECHCVNT